MSCALFTRPICETYPQGFQFSIRREVSDAAVSSALTVIINKNPTPLATKDKFLL
jgi:hypothetical protein